MPTHTVCCLEFQKTLLASNCILFEIYKSENSSAYRMIFTTALNICPHYQMKTVTQKNLNRTEMKNLLGIALD